MKGLSILVPYAAGPRDGQWAWCRRRWETLLPDAQVCVGGLPLPEGGPGLFNRARAINLAAEQATGSVFLICGADMVVDLETLREAFYRADAGPFGRDPAALEWSVPRSYTWLTRKATRLVLGREGEAAWRDVADQHDSALATNGTVWVPIVLPAVAFRKVGGMDERFEGWGPEDVALVLALQALWPGGYRRTLVAHHLWHEAPPEETWGRPGYEAVWPLYERYIGVAPGDAAAMRTIVEEGRSR